MKKYEKGIVWDKHDEWEIECTAGSFCLQYMDQNSIQASESQHQAMRMCAAQRGEIQSER